MDVNPDRLNTFIGKMLGDVGAAMNASLMLIGDKLGLYKTLSEKDRSPHRNSRRRQIPASAMSANGSPLRRRPAMSTMTPYRANSR